MSNLPENTRLGKLEYLEVYDYYDQPCLFSCRSEDGRTFLALWVDENEGGDRWLYVGISPTRLKWLKEGVLELRTAFTKAVSGYIYDVKIDRQGVANIKPLSCANLTDDLLPVTGEFLKYTKVN